MAVNSGKQGSKKMRTKKTPPAAIRLDSSGMSYKFQRLRERIRQAVASGELSGKLPGERELARRFQVNAKTLSKALTDLAAEGLLQRSIGRGTFVRNSKGELPQARGSWLLLVDSTSDQTLVDHLKTINPHAETCQDVSSIRPSVVSQFRAVVDLAAATPEAIIRDLLVRGIPVMAVGQEPRTYSLNGVFLDSMLGAAHLTRQLILGGHRHFLAVEERARITVADAIRRTAARYCDDYCVDACPAADVAQAVEYGATACICDSVRAATRILESLNRAGIAVPGKLSVAAIGWSGEDYPCTGYYVDPRRQAEAVAEILDNGNSGRPTTLWLTGLPVDRQTTAPLKVVNTPTEIPLQMLAAVPAQEPLPLIDRLPHAPRPSER
jgi:DNA-binding transcriptional regulator YhcF (GntR family)